MVEIDGVWYNVDVIWGVAYDPEDYSLDTDDGMGCSYEWEDKFATAAFY